MSTAKFKRIALLFDPSLGYCRDVLEGVQRFARQRPGWIFFDAVGTKSALRALREWEPQGMLVHLFERGFAQELAKLNVPTVNTTSTLLDCKFPLIEIDHQKVGRMAAEFFLNRGYERFGFFGSQWAHFSVAREDSFKQCLTEHGFTVSSCYEEFLPRRVDRESWKFVQRKTVNWLQGLLTSGGPVAVFVSNDLPARFLSNYCRNLGIRVPQDMALLSVDNDRYECNLASPTLSSVELPSREIGQRAAALLDRMLKGRRAPKSPQWLPPVRIVLRGSTEATAVQDEDVRAFFRWLHDCYDQPGTAEDLCAQIGVGRRTLERKLNNLLGTTIGSEIRRRRLDQAMRLLLESSETVGQIAYRTGYSSPERFAVVFRESLSMTPTEFRKRNSLGSPPQISEAV